jgi:hypothetical protein
MGRKSSVQTTCTKKTCTNVPITRLATHVASLRQLGSDQSGLPCATGHCTSSPSLVMQVTHAFGKRPHLLMSQMSSNLQGVTRCELASLKPLSKRPSAPQCHTKATVATQSAAAGGTSAASPPYWHTAVASMRASQCIVPLLPCCQCL